MGGERSEARRPSQSHRQLSEVNRTGGKIQLRRGCVRLEPHRDSWLRARVERYRCGRWRIVGA